MPKTLEVEYDTLGSADVSSALRLMNQDLSKGYIAELCGFPHPGRANFGGKGTGPLLFVKDADNPRQYEFIGDAPQFEHRPEQTYRMRTLKEPGRITLFVDGRQVFSERVTPIYGSVLQLQGWGAAQDHVHFDNLIVRVPKERSREKNSSIPR